MKWVVEANVFGPEYQRVVEAIKAAGHEVIEWREEWLTERADWVAEDGGQDHVLFHGSLNVASKLREAQPAWVPGAFCDVGRYQMVHLQMSTIQDHLLNGYNSMSCRVSTLGLGLGESLIPWKGVTHVFIRPNDALKSFSGRVVAVDQLSPEAVDFGFYYDDDPMVCFWPARTDIAVEFRCVVVGEKVVSCVAYNPNGREATEVSSAVKQAAQEYAESIADDYVDRPEHVYVLDVARLDDGSHRVIETNPFSGADLYTACMGIHEVDELVKALSKTAERFVLPCCETMASQLRYWCDQHKAECPDRVVLHGCRGTVFLRAENACYTMRYCPWCGRLIEENDEENDEESSRILGL